MPTPSRGPVYNFQIPNLPRPVYFALQEFCQRQNTGRWHAILAFITLGLEVEQSDSARLEDVLQRVKSLY